MYRALLKEIKEFLSKCNDVPCERTGRFNIVKMAILAKLIYRAYAFPFKIPICRKGKAESKIHMEI